MDAKHLANKALVFSYKFFMYLECIFIKYQYFTFHEGMIISYSSNQELFLVISFIHFTSLIIHLFLYTYFWALYIPSLCLSSHYYDVDRFILRSVIGIKLRNPALQVFS